MPKFQLDDYVTSNKQERTLGTEQPSNKICGRATDGTIIAIHTRQLGEEFDISEDGDPDSFDEWDTGYMVQTQNGQLYETDQIYLVRAVHPAAHLQRSLDL